MEYNHILLQKHAVPTQQETTQSSSAVQLMDLLIPWTGLAGQGGGLPTQYYP